MPASGLGYRSRHTIASDGMSRRGLKKPYALVFRNFSCNVIVKTGNRPAQEIIVSAEELGADLILMTTRGRAGVPRLVVGSVAERVIRESRRSALAFRPHGPAR